MVSAIRGICVVVALAVMAGAGTNVVLHKLRYKAWVEANYAQLSGARHDLERYERRRSAGLYRSLPTKTEMADAEAADVAEPVVKRLDGERQNLFNAIAPAQTLLKLSFGVALILGLVAKFLPKGRSRSS